jgi:Ca2+-binding RTX toxin-like protein
MNVDRVMDFSRKQGDKVVLSYKYFKAVNLVLKNGPFGGVEEDRRLDLPVGYLSKNEFRIGGTALLETDRIVYDKASGALYYDMDGSAAAAAIKIAAFKPGTTVSWSDFIFY